MIDRTRRVRAEMRARRRARMLRQAVVTAVAGDGTVSLSIGGAPAVAGFKRLASYSPAVDDAVWVLREGPVWLVLGKTA